MTIKAAHAQGVHVLPCSFPSLNPLDVFPVVDFLFSKFASGPQYKRTLVTPALVDVYNAAGGLEARRHSIPLILAWVSLWVHTP